MVTALHASLGADPQHGLPSCSTTTTCPHQLLCQPGSPSTRSISTWGPGGLAHHTTPWTCSWAPQITVTVTAPRGHCGWGAHPGNSFPFLAWSTKLQPQPRWWGGAHCILEVTRTHPSHTAGPTCSPTCLQPCIVPGPQAWEPGVSCWSPLPGPQFLGLPASEPASPPAWDLRPWDCKNPERGCCFPPPTRQAQAKQQRPWKWRPDSQSLSAGPERILGAGRPGALLGRLWTGRPWMP